MEKKLIFSLCIFALILRLGWAIHLKEAGLVFSDAVSYDQLGMSIAHGKGYVDSEEKPTAMRSPIYPIFIGCIYWLFGEHNLFVVRIFQAILGSFSCLLVFLIGKRVFNPQVGLIGAFLASWNPYLIYYTGHILQETLFIFMALALIYFLTKINDGIVFIVLSGIFAGLSILTREVFVFYIPFLFIGFFFVTRLKKIALFFLIFAFVWSFWLIRNYFTYGGVVTRSAGEAVSKGGGIWILFWQGNNPYLDKGELEKEGNYISVGIINELSLVPLEKRDEYAKKKALELILSDPIRTLKVHIIKFGRFWRLYPHKTKLLSELTQKSTDWAKIVSLLSDGWIIPLGLIGFLLALPLWQKHLFLSLWIWGMCFGHILFYPMIRYRLPVMPMVMLFTGYAIFKGYDFIQRRCGY
ncbi:MAG: glycosyltransferase family 39 protein [bacterium]